LHQRVDDVRAVVFDASEIDVLHPVEVSAGCIQQRLHLQIAQQHGQFPNHLRGVAQFGARS
jgi:hypothetical protein